MPPYLYNNAAALTLQLPSATTEACVRRLAMRAESNPASEQNKEAEIGNERASNRIAVRGKHGSIKELLISNVSPVKRQSSTSSWIRP
jgi:hypothetical protein